MANRFAVVVFGIELPTISTFSRPIYRILGGTCAAGWTSYVNQATIIAVREDAFQTRPKVMAINLATPKKILTLHKAMMNSNQHTAPSVFWSFPYRCLHGGLKTKRNTSEFKVFLKKLKIVCLFSIYKVFLLKQSSGRKVTVFRNISDRQQQCYRNATISTPIWRSFLYKIPSKTPTINKNQVKLA